MLIVTEAWKTAFPGAVAGALVMHNVMNPERHTGLDHRKAELEGELRARYAGYDRAALGALPILQAYAAYYRRFKKTYHVAAQLESLVLKGKPIPSVAALVEAMFMAELESLLLTAGHDLDAVQGAVTLDVSFGHEQYTLLRGQPQELKPGDMIMADAQGIISSVIYGPDQRTQITSATRRALFTVYAPAGIGVAAVEQHLHSIQANVQRIAAEASVESLDVYPA
jgi:DNA/RNA-binding domain of Phe-tRNA-synthetase-like protein